MLARAARLTPEARRLLEAVAIVPLEADVWLLEALAGEVLPRLDETLASGMLATKPGAVAFRHELARLAIAESVAPHRAVELHRKAVVALAQPPSGKPDVARLAHHAEAAGDADGVLAYAREAGALASALGAHREAAAQYGRALRVADALAPQERAALLEDRAGACFLTDQYDPGIAALQEALAIYRKLGDRLKEGDVLRWLSEFLWCPGRVPESQEAGAEAVSILEELPPGPELAKAYVNLADGSCDSDAQHESVMWAGRGLELATSVGDDETAIHALAVMGFAEGDDAGIARLEESVQRALDGGFDREVAHSHMLLARHAVERRQYAVADKHLDAGLEFCNDQGIELYRYYLMAYRARIALDRGEWAKAAAAAEEVLRIRRTSTTPRIVALVVLALVRARRGDPGYEQMLDEAWQLAEPTGELPRIRPVVAARAEVAWLNGERDSWQEVDTQVAWGGLGCPYEAALVMAESDDEDSVRQAGEALQALGAKAATTFVSQRLRDLGARGLPRGPREVTRSNPANLTEREVEVLALLAEGLRNAEIASRLVVSRRTVDHHVSAILRKLDVRTRGQAGAEAIRRGLLG